MDERVLRFVVEEGRRAAHELSASPASRRTRLGDLPRVGHIIRQHSKTFSLAARCLPRRSRKAVEAFYAFCRSADDFADHLGEEGKPRLEAYLAAIRGGAPAPDPILASWLAIGDGMCIPRRWSESLVETLLADTQRSVVPKLEDLLGYAYGVASTVGLITTVIVGYRRTSSLEDVFARAITLGIAMQLTNILRDVAEDLSRGRIYLPVEDLQRFGVTADHLACGRLHEGWQQLLQHYIGAPALRVRHPWHSPSCARRARAGRLGRRVVPGHLARYRTPRRRRVHPPSARTAAQETPHRVLPSVARRLRMEFEGSRALHGHVVPQHSLATRRCAMTGKRITVIGSGFGGLAAAVRPQARGFQVDLFERLPEPGGRARTFEMGGYQFDGGPTVVTAPFLFEELFELAGQRFDRAVELLPVDPFYKLFGQGGNVLTYNGDPAFVVPQMEAIHAPDAPGYLQFLRAAEPLLQKGFVELGAEPFLRATDMARVAPDLARLRAYESVYRFVGRYIQHPFLRQCFTFHPLFIGGNPLKASAIYAMIHLIEQRWGVWYPRGGMRSLVEALVALFCDLGGRLHLGTSVDASSSPMGESRA